MCVCVYLFVSVIVLLSVLFEAFFDFYYKLYQRNVNIPLNPIYNTKYHFNSTNTSLTTLINKKTYSNILSYKRTVVSVS